MDLNMKHKTIEILEDHAEEKSLKSTNKQKKKPDPH